MKQKLEELSLEMLNEIRELKDLTKKELPVVAKEYITALKVQGFVGLLFGLFLLSICASSGIYALVHDFGERFSDTRFGLSMLSLISGILGLILTGTNISCLLDVYLQPRRTAIKAVTSLFNGD